jgi:2-keto-4-pentenoate hydratase/2-oxohepta-3-ene-1,7-dioic acid hydratase in catechol pathway
MRIVSFQRRSRTNRAGILLPKERVLDLGRAYTRYRESKSAEGADTMAIIENLRGLGATVVDLLAGGDEPLAQCFDIAKAALAGEMEEFTYALADVTLVAPVPHPPLLLHFNCFEKHAAAEAFHHGASKNNPLPRDWFHYPLHYYGNPSNLIGTNAHATFPEGETQMDFEAEFGVVLGEDVFDATLEEAEDAILGYTLVNDWTARSMEHGLIHANVGPSRAKTFCTAVGPVLVTKDEVPDPANLRMKVRLNGELFAEATIADARFTFAEMISYASEGTTLPAGTLICSGAIPGGSCIEREKFLKPGDVIEIECDPIGILRNNVWERQHPRVYRPKRV